MTLISQSEWNGLEAIAPDDQISFRGERLYIDGVLISSWDCPECLKRDSGCCEGCLFFDPLSCRLRYDPELRCDLKAILDEYRERLRARRARQQQFVNALREELRAHGRPLHYTVLAQMVADRHPALRVTESKVLKVLVYYSEIFEKTDEGVYQLRITQ